jgi:hypothetical protein
MPSLPSTGKTSPSPSSRVNKESSRFKRSNGQQAGFKCHHPLTSEALDKSVPPSPMSEATRKRRHSVKMGEV